MVVQSLQLLVAATTEHVQTDLHDAQRCRQTAHERTAKHARVEYHTRVHMRCEPVWLLHLTLSSAICSAMHSLSSACCCLANSSCPGFSLTYACDRKASMYFCVPP